jgi:hypothetical protein
MEDNCPEGIWYCRKMKVEDYRWKTIAWRAYGIVENAAKSTPCPPPEREIGIQNGFITQS